MSQPPPFLLPQRPWSRVSALLAGAGRQRVAVALLALAAVLIAGFVWIRAAPGLVGPDDSRGDGEAVAAALADPSAAGSGAAGSGRHRLGRRRLRPDPPASRTRHLGGLVESDRPGRRPRRRPCPPPGPGPAPRRQPRAGRHPRRRRRHLRRRPRRVNLARKLTDGEQVLIPGPGDPPPPLPPDAGAAPGHPIGPAGPQHRNRRAARHPPRGRRGHRRPHRRLPLRPPLHQRRRASRGPRHRPAPLRAARGPGDRHMTRWTTREPDAVLGPPRAAAGLPTDGWPASLGRPPGKGGHSGDSSRAPPSRPVQSYAPSVRMMGRASTPALPQRRRGASPPIRPDIDADPDTAGVALAAATTAGVLLGTRFPLAAAWVAATLCLVAASLGAGLGGRVHPGNDRTGDGIRPRNRVLAGVLVLGALLAAGAAAASVRATAIQHGVLAGWAGRPGRVEVRGAVTEEPRRVRYGGYWVVLTVDRVRFAGRTHRTRERASLFLARSQGEALGRGLSAQGEALGQSAGAQGETFGPRSSGQGEALGPGPGGQGEAVGRSLGEGGRLAVGERLLVRASVAAARWSDPLGRQPRVVLRRPVIEERAPPRGAGGPVLRASEAMRDAA